MRWLRWGTKPSANFKTAHFVKYLGSMLMDFHETSITGIFGWDDWNEWQKPSSNFKTACLVKYLSSLFMDFHEFSIAGILLMRLLKISCIWKTFCFILCFLHLIFTHTHTCIHTYMYVCLCVWQLSFCAKCSTEINVHVIS